MKGCRAFLDHEVTAILNAFEGEYAVRNRALFILGVRTGLRVQELCSLRVGDVLVNGAMSLRVHVSRASTKRKSEGRSVVFHPEAQAAVKAWLDELGTVSADTYLFCSQKGANSPITRQQAWRILKAAFERAGVYGETGTHCMRKTFAKRVKKSAKDNLLVVQKALGHKRLDSTVAYLGVDDEEIDAAVLSA